MCDSESPCHSKYSNFAHRVKQVEKDFVSSLLRQCQGIPQASLPQISTSRKCDHQVCSCYQWCWNGWNCYHDLYIFETNILSCLFLSGVWCNALSGWSVWLFHQTKRLDDVFRGRICAPRKIVSFWLWVCKWLDYTFGDLQGWEEGLFYRHSSAKEEPQQTTGGWGE